MYPTSSTRNAPSVKYMPSSLPSSSRYRRTSSSNSSCQRGVESGQRAGVGGNRFQQEEERVAPTFALGQRIQLIGVPRRSSAAKLTCRPNAKALENNSSAADKRRSTPILAGTAGLGLSS